MHLTTVKEFANEKGLSERTIYRRTDLYNELVQRNINEENKVWDRTRFGSAYKYAKHLIEEAFKQCVG